MSLTSSKCLHGKRLNLGNRLRIEALEKRMMLASDCVEGLLGGVTGNTSQVPNLSSSAFLGSVAEEYGNEAPTAIQTAANFSTSDAGATRRTAANLGILNGGRELQGSLSVFDRWDVFQVELSSDATFEATLTELSADANLVLTNARGNVIDLSRNAGRTDEAITRDLQAGTYYVGVRSNSFWGTRYELDLREFSLVPSPESPEDPVEGSPANAVPVTAPGVSPPTGTDGSTSGTDVPIVDVNPFADVSYYGSRNDWNVNAVGAPETWAHGYTGEGVTVAIVDTGVDLDHPDLVGNLYVNPGEIPGNGQDDDRNGFIDDVHGYDFVSRDGTPDDGNGHGTHVAGSVAALQNGFGATGVAPDATILPVRVLNDRGSGSDFSVSAGIRYAADMGAQIINLSLGGSYSRAIQSAIEYAQSLGALVIAAAGNESAAVPSYPARLSSSLQNVLSVGAYSSSERIAGFSNQVGVSNATQIDAPGVGVYSTHLFGGYAALSGTSMASPHVAGIAALALSANPGLSAEQLRGLLVEGATARAIGSDSLGIANAATTVAYAAAGVLPSNASTGASVGLVQNLGSQRQRAINLDEDIVRPLIESAGERMHDESSTSGRVDREESHNQDSISLNAINDHAWSMQQIERIGYGLYDQVLERGDLFQEVAPVPVNETLLADILSQSIETLESNLSELK